MPNTRQSKRLSSSSSHDSNNSSEGPTNAHYGENLRRNRETAEEDLTDLQQQFAYLFELRFQEKMKSLAEREKIIMDGNSAELLSGVIRLEEAMAERIDRAEKLRDARLNCCNMKFEAEELTIQRTYEEEKQKLKESYASEIREEIRLLEAALDEDFHTTARLQMMTRQPKVEQKTTGTSKRAKESKQEEDNANSKKTPWPHIIYQLRETEVLEDLAVTKQALARKARLDRNKQKKAARAKRVQL